MTALSTVGPGIFRWETVHPDWEEGDGWAPAVASFALATADGLVLVDPLIRDDRDGDAAWADVDALAADHGPVRAVVRLLHYHHRSVAQASARFDVPIYARPVPRAGIPEHPSDHAIGDGGELLGGMVGHHVSRDDEVVLWVPWAETLVCADVLGRPEGRVELCPDRWVSAPDSRRALRAELAAICAAHPVRHLLLSHGPHRSDDAGEIPGALARAAARPLGPFIEFDDLEARRERYHLIDARLSLIGADTHAAYLRAHLPGARWLDFASVLSDPPGPDASGGRHPLPSPERFAAGLSALGVSDGDTVIAYDDAGGVLAARLVWLLRILGEEAALLTPVPDRWVAGEPEPVTPGHFSARPWPADRFAGISEVAEAAGIAEAAEIPEVAGAAEAASTAEGAAGAPAPLLLDARDPDRYAGGTDPLDPRPGHIPGAVNVPCRANLDPDGRLLPTAELIARLRAAGVTGDRAVISSCGSGVTACHTLLVLEAVGVEDGRLYPGSFSEWSRDLTRAVATGTPRDPASR
ncbi:rhodanese-like domain-containing protein [Conexibacter sp. DBS9H8]|uniref:rhodanese-like domain-containing protein n=1 Tax=Conexibacter sp. DBS9H8 TaxID=2937801 RepID=UPI00201030ED|nr:rhodanese-like domain-containing protein [Conexibacter sp. DBS9H8]